MAALPSGGSPLSAFGFTQNHSAGPTSPGSCVPTRWMPPLTKDVAVCSVGRQQVRAPSQPRRTLCAQEPSRRTETHARGDHCLRDDGAALQAGVRAWSPQPTASREPSGILESRTGSRGDRLLH